MNSANVYITASWYQPKITDTLVYTDLPRYSKADILNVYCIKADTNALVKQSNVTLAQATVLSAVAAAALGTAAYLAF